MGIVRMFELMQISNVNNNFVDKVMCGYLARNLVDQMMDSPYYLQFIASLIAQLIFANHISAQSLDLFCESVVTHHEDDEGVGRYCDKLKKYALKETELLYTMTSSPW